MVKNSSSVSLLILLVATSFLFYSCKNEPPAKTPPAYKVMEVREATGELQVNFPTTIESSQVVEVRPRVEGYLDKIYLKEGSKVKKGDPLFLINQDDCNQRFLAAQADVLLAQANLDNAKLEVEKVTPLVRQSIVSEHQLTSAKSNQKAAEARLAQAKAAEEQARINLNYTVIKAPATGSVGLVNVREGALIRLSDQTPLTVISAEGDVFAYFSISENLLRSEERIDSDKFPAAKLKLSNGSIYDEDGKLELASDIVNTHTGSLMVKAIFPNNKNLLRTGQNGEVIISLTIPNAILVPQQATYELLNKVMVVVVDANNTTTAREISILGSDDNNYIVNKGLQPGDRIVIEGVRKLTDGTIITPIEN
ncbi:efflux RND transporter periplasmic adaptor subunit [Bacteroidales bacterium OttesenSCG-928-B11]|nr:efflux RND transporter periplasmic adaptor subunit [Bacteroidales bacterium OttesenSCG-928-E04]MDL2308494.1 efflux RND transporter periplasmic adaptor subunit [Bacteroidales bacterium OttesenSCG-928-C03]MDL2311421.1 efflux RND transporter periplasmic adaptor subunit [Bacteroidales bacterium OttesenSCG-928-B11]MDL2325817.1 efflux RND transporter periplasmic adaptor subunit [Bacteroidales bacterium OttesenSCG-928-A14]